MSIIGVGGEVEVSYSQGNIWEDETSPPNKWSKRIRRIKPAHEPEIGDVYEMDNCNRVLLSIDSESNYELFRLTPCGFTHTINFTKEQLSKLKCIGKIDFSIFEVGK